MLHSRSVLDRVFRRFVPSPIDAFAPSPEPIGDKIWILDRWNKHFGIAHQPSRSTIIQLPSRELVVISPPSLADDDAVKEIDELGKVRYVVIPNSFHWIHARAFAERYPDAQLFVAPDLRRRAPQLASGIELTGTPPTSWSSEIDTIVLGPIRGLSEVLFFHRSSATLILTDLAFNLRHYPRAIDRWLWRAAGIPAGFGPGRSSRWFLLGDRDQVSRCLDRALRWPIRQIVVAHGDLVTQDPVAALRRAFADFFPNDALMDTPR